MNQSTYCRSNVVGRHGDKTKASEVMITINMLYCSSTLTRYTNKIQWVFFFGDTRFKIILELKDVAKQVKWKSRFVFCLEETSRFIDTDKTCNGFFTQFQKVCTHFVRSS